MKYKKQFSRYLNDLGAKSPTPGGGSAANLVFCLGVSLMEMAVNFSINNNRKLKGALCVFKNIKDKVLPVVDSDSEIFLRALKAKNKDKKRAYRELAKITFALGSNCIKILIVAKAIRVFIKKNIISDFDLGSECLKVALRASIKNLEANSSIFASQDKKKISYLKGYLKKFG